MKKVLPGMFWLLAGPRSTNRVQIKALLSVHMARQLMSCRKVALISFPCLKKKDILFLHWNVECAVDYVNKPDGQVSFHIAQCI